MKCCTLSLQIVPKKITIGIWVSIAKIPFMKSEKSNQIIKLWLFSTIQWRPHLIWPSSHKEIWIFAKQVIGPFLPSFVTWMYVASTGRLCSQKTSLQTYSNCMHTFLTKVVPDNLKACQICKIRVNNTFHKDQGQLLGKKAHNWLQSESIKTQHFLIVHCFKIRE